MDSENDALDDVHEDLEKSIYEICLNYLEEYISLLSNLQEPSTHEIDVIITEMLELCPTIIIENEIKTFKDKPIVEIIENLQEIRNNLVSINL
jgi:hypothetical protein